MRLLPVVAAVAFLLTLAVACSRGDGQPTPTPTPTVEQLERPDLAPLVRGPISPDGLQAILGTADLAVGTNRVGFVLTSDEGFVTDRSTVVSSRHLPDGEAKEKSTATYHPWPYGPRGLYVTWLTFDRPGGWALDIDVEDSDGSIKTAQLRFDVPETTSAPSIGSAAVRSKSKTLDDVESFAELVTGTLHDPDLYQTTIADAVGSGMPTVIVFASPAFCINEVCGPQVEVLQELKNEYKGQANFIHVDLYDNPGEVQSAPERARISPVVLEWRLPSQEWTFVIDRQGTVSARFEAFATLEEVEGELLRVL